MNAKRMPRKPRTGPKRPKGQPTKIGSFFWNVLRKKGYETPIKQQQILQQWPEIVGPKIAEQTEAADLRDMALFVRVSNAAWRNELVFLKPEIISKINDFAGKQLVQDIIFTSRK